MDCTTRHENSRHGLEVAGVNAVAALLLAMVALPPCRADSVLQTAAPTRAGVVSSAHIDFRITVMPSLALLTQATGVRVQGNGGVTIVQRGAADGGAATHTLLLRPRHQVTDLAVPVLGSRGGDLVTVASP